MEALDHIKLPVNFASMIGTGAVKITVKGFADTPYTREEMEAARALVEDAMKEGAAGVSVGIMYLPECYSTADEFAGLLEPVGRYGGVVTAHIRGEGDSMVDSVREIIEIGKKAGCAVEISHFKSCGGSQGSGTGCDLRLLSLRGRIHSPDHHGSPGVCKGRHGKCLKAHGNAGGHKGVQGCLQRAL